MYIKKGTQNGARNNLKYKKIPNIASDHVKVLEKAPSDEFKVSVGFKHAKTEAQAVLCKKLILKS